MTAPKFGTPEYRLWAQGAEDEAAARWDGVDPADKEAMVLVHALACAWNERRLDHTPSELLVTAAWIMVAGLRLRTRLRLAWDLVRP